MSYLRDKFKKIEEEKEKGKDPGLLQDGNLPEKKQARSALRRKGRIKLLLWTLIWGGITVWVTWAIAATFKKSAKYF